MIKQILSNYKKVIRYSVYLLIILNIVDIISTYIGIKYFNVYEANEKTAYLFDLFGILLPSIFKVLTVLLLGYVIQNVWEKAEFLLFNTGGWLNSVIVILSLNTMFIIFFLNFWYFFIVINNINVIYSYL